MEERLLKRGETSGRTDDNIESIKKRFKTFISQTMPVIQLYEKRGKMRKIDTNRPVEEIYNDIQKIFKELRLS